MVAIPTVTVFPSRNGESVGIYKSNIIPVEATPTEVVFIPVITPKSPVYETLSIISYLGWGDSINISGGFVDVYPNPGLEIEIDVIEPLVIIALAWARPVSPTPIGLLIDIEGVVLYPTPLFDNMMEEIVPAEETTAVAAAEIKESWDIINILFCGFSVVPSCKYSLSLSKNVLTFSTKNTLEVVSISWIIFELGWI